MTLTERLNVLIHAVTLSQKSGSLTLDEAVHAKSAIDIITTTGTINQNFTSAINSLIELIITSQKRGVYSFKDAHIIYLAVEGIEGEIQNEINKLNEKIKASEPIEPQQAQQAQQHILEYPNNETTDNKTVTIPPKILKRRSSN